MKKQYEAPAIFFDDFSLSTSIAGNCGIMVNANRYVCAYYDERQEKTVFTDEVANCVTKNEDYYNGVCYHVPVDKNDLFNS